MYFIISSSSSKKLKRETSSQYVAAPSYGPVPDSPTMMESTGSLVGQATFRFWKADYLTNGSAISAYPITSTVVYLSNSDANARAGVYTHSTDAGTASVTSTINSVAAGTWYVTAISTNANGSSYRSQVYTITVT